MGHLPLSTRSEPSIQQPATTPAPASLIHDANVLGAQEPPSQGELTGSGWLRPRGRVSRWYLPSGEMLTASSGAEGMGGRRALTGNHALVRL